MMKTQIKRLAALFTVILMCLSLVGCIRLDFGVTIKKNGKADISMMYAISDTMASLSDTELFSEDEIASYEEKGYTVTPYSNDGYSGVTLTKQDMEISELTNLDGSMGEIAGNDFLKKDGNTYILNMDLFSGEDMKESVQYLGMLAQSGGYMHFTLTTPVKAVNHNAATVSEDGKTLTWDLLAMNGEPIHAEFSLSSMVWLPLALAALAVILIVAAIIVMKKKKDTGAETAAEADLAVVGEDAVVGEKANETAEAAEVIEETAEKTVEETEATEDVVEAAAGEVTAEATGVAVEKVPVVDEKLVEKVPAVDENAVITQLREYKKLLDEGIITAEEFEQKKQQLLKLNS